MSEILFLLLVGHFIADYWFQTAKMIERKNSVDNRERQKGLVTHVVIHFLTYLLLLMFLGEISSKTILTVFAISIIHYLIDFGKVSLEARPTRKKNSIKLFKQIKHYAETVPGKASLYITDQLLHLMTIIAMLHLFSIIDYRVEQYIHFIETLLFTNALTLSTLDKLLLITSLIIFTTHFSGYLIGILLTNIRPTDSTFTEARTENKNIMTLKHKKKEVEEESTVENVIIQTSYSEPSFEVGRYIGMLERLIIMILVAMNAFTGITFLVATKALTRFKQFEDKRFAEYYLIGSLLSILLALGSGYLLLKIIS
ncbi:DUF3307 domain-containing protein [Metabacillus malikii]|uniref:DUF3307 domain-containing protein n=1 Tax=Metabacillus malikii TaxID=1504265 RepID=A0ABT9ZFD3_9BACI|nr:DUF3307 domain-containing protein [Metabacillus malikii]MDQ0230685.1 hypothetical protein [Metabacillus malikii]